MANWADTVAALQPLLPDGRPRLTQELLGRPPFRFLVDVVSAVQQATGFPSAGLFGEAEADPRAMAKEARLAYLERLFAAISGALGQPVPARPSKVVAGLEPERTNEALQLLAAAAARGSTGHAAQAAQGAAPGGPARYAAPTSPARQPPPLPSADEAGPPVVFAPLENLLPALAWQVAEARAALSGADAPTSSQEALACCERVQAVGQHAATLTRCLEALQTSAATVAAECTAWRTEADQAAARLEAEARAEAEAGGASAQQLARLDAEIGRVRQRLAAAGGRQ